MNCLKIFKKFSQIRQHCSRRVVKQQSFTHFIVNRTAMEAPHFLLDFSEEVILEKDHDFCQDNLNSINYNAVC